MKKFTLYILFTFIGAAFIYALLVSLTFLYRDIVKWKIDPKVTTVIFGNSTGESAINDAILDNCANLCKSGATYNLNRYFILPVLEANPHIETVVLCYGPFTYTHFSDQDFYEAKPFYFREYAGFISFLGFKIFNKFSSKQVVNALLKSNYLPYALPLKCGYRRLTTNNIHHGGWSVESYDCQYPTKIDIPYKDSKKTHGLEHQALREIISFCLERRLKVVLMATPKYHIDRWFGRKGYEDFLSTLDESVQIADYDSFPMPSDEYYADVQHLNYRGADYFSSHLKNNGLKSVPLTEYLKH